MPWPLPIGFIACAGALRFSQHSAQQGWAGMMPQGHTWHSCRRPSGVQTHSASSLRLMASPVSCRMLGPGDSICLTAGVACSASHVHDCVILLQ